MYSYLQYRLPPWMGTACFLRTTSPNCRPSNSYSLLLVVARSVETYSHPINRGIQLLRSRYTRPHNLSQVLNHFSNVIKCAPGAPRYDNERAQLEQGTTMKFPTFFQSATKCLFVMVVLNILMNTVQSSSSSSTEQERGTETLHVDPMDDTAKLLQNEDPLSQSIRALRKRKERMSMSMSLTMSPSPAPPPAPTPSPSPKDACLINVRW